MFYKLIKIKTLQQFSLTLIFFFFMFSRSFMGIYIFGFRIGEYVILSGLLLSFFYLYKNFKNDILDKKIQINYVFIILSFLLSLLISDSSFSDTYTYKSSSYIWVLSFIFLGYQLSDNNFDKKILKAFTPLPFVVYFIQVLLPKNIQNIIEDFFYTYSDKLEFHKGSDLALIYVVIISINNKYLTKENYKFHYFLTVSSLFLPLLLFKSRSAFFAATLFFLFEIFKNRRFYIKDLKTMTISILILSSVFTLSVFFILNSSSLEKDDSIVDLQSIIEFRYQGYDQYNEDLPLLFIKEKRIYSVDGNLNWRLQIWQDVVKDLNTSPLLKYFGYGYKNIIPAMDIESRQGNGIIKNENVHNNFINIYARGGMLQLILFISLYLFIIKIYKTKFKNLNILYFLLPLLFCSFFDASMENSHYPVIFYFFLGRLLKVEY